MLPDDAGEEAVEILDPALHHVLELPGPLLHVPRREDGEDGKEREEDPHGDDFACDVEDPANGDENFGRFAHY